MRRSERTLSVNRRWGAILDSTSETLMKSHWFTIFLVKSMPVHLPCKKPATHTRTNTQQLRSRLPERLTGRLLFTAKSYWCLLATSRTANILHVLRHYTAQKHSPYTIILSSTKTYFSAARVDTCGVSTSCVINTGWSTKTLTVLTTQNTDPNQCENMPYKCNII